MPDKPIKTGITTKKWFPFAVVAAIYIALKTVKISRKI